jgi:hypothetical protein
MNLPHWHLLLNHVPTVGFGVGLALFLAALAAREQPLQRESLRIIVLAALVSIPVYLTGVSAGRLIEGLEGVSAIRIRIHADAALLAFVVMELTGGLAWLALWQARRFTRARPGTIAAVAVLAVASFGLMARAAYIGGLIRHPEVLSVEDAAPTETAWLTNDSVKALLLNTTSVWPAAETIHFIGMALSFGIVLVLNLRILGVMKPVAFAELHRLMPWGMMGVAINLASGMLFFIAIPEQYDTNISFQWKMLLLVLAGVNLLYFTSAEDPWKTGAGVDASIGAKVVAASTIALWAGVIFFGRMLPYIGGAF